MLLNKQSTMTIFEFKNQLVKLNELLFRLPNNDLVPLHFHVTEVGVVSKNYIDCGGQIRNEHYVSFQLWVADDAAHRLTPSGLLAIISKAEKLVGIEDDFLMDVEYQQGTIGRFGLQFADGCFKLTSTQTACLAVDACGIPQEKSRVQLVELNSTASSCCSPGGGCC